MDYIKSTGVQPITYNIILMRDGEELKFPFPPATPEMVVQFGYCLPIDKRCKEGLIKSTKELEDALSPVLGKNFSGDLLLPPRKQVIIALHNTSILGYQRQAVIDPRISNEIAVLWQIYLDERVFPTAQDAQWQMLMTEIVMSEIKDKLADERLAEDIKERLIEEAKNQN